MDSRIGRAAPTVVSYLRVAPISMAASFRAAYCLYGEENVILLQATTEYPFLKRFIYLKAMSAEAVQSTNTEFSSERVARWVKYASSAELIPLSNCSFMFSRDRPFLSRMNLRLFERPHTCRRRPVRFSIFSLFFAMMSTSAFPTTPYPAMKRWMSFPLLRSKNSLWMVRMAASASDEAMIAEMFLSEEPWAVALTGMLLRPSAASMRPVAPVWLSTSSPTRHTMEYPFSTFSGLSFPRDIS